MIGVVLLAVALVACTEKAETIEKWRGKPHEVEVAPQAHQQTRHWEDSKDGIQAQGTQQVGGWGDEANGGKWEKNEGKFGGVDAQGNKIDGGFNAESKGQKFENKDKDGKVTRGSSYSTSSSYSYSTNKP